MELIKHNIKRVHKIKEKPYNGIMFYVAELTVESFGLTTTVEVVFPDKETLDISLERGYYLA